ncbi:MAG: acetyl/propionyl-CoA carboxylase alpha subunit/acetyl-CoA carboxylase carboxyltransferase component [Candidatus Azotimanducaceae bacterium]|jgi:acetyl/propionyl-CoA carboxylase alpha subunit/acetyl-CoA carboxylase carboxyltransferase component
MKKLLIANRGEIAVRILRAANDLGIATVAIFSTDDAEALHCKLADEALPLSNVGAGAYLDIEQIIAVAITAKCDGIHPGYGFLSENPEFATKCREAGITFIGPTSVQLQQFGDKSSARTLAAECGVPLLVGTNGDTSLEAAQTFVSSLPAGSQAIIKAIAGGGGRGMRLVESIEDLATLLPRAKAEANAAFGDDRVYLEQFVPKARHIEVQIIGDGSSVQHLGERECTIQRNHQKIVEIAPSPSLNDKQRNALIDAAMRMAGSVDYQSLGTFEFLVEVDDPDQFYFIEANPRLQVEHTVTEAITHIDLVQLQIKLAMGESLSSFDLQSRKPDGFAIQCRINMETLSKKGRFKPTGGQITVFEPPTGIGLRTDHFAYAGYQTSNRFDSLLAKLIVHTPNTYTDAIRKTAHALEEFRIEGFETNLDFLKQLFALPEFQNNQIYTRFVDDKLTDFVVASQGQSAKKTQSSDPLAVLHHKNNSPTAQAEIAIPDDSNGIYTPLQGTIIELLVSAGDDVTAGQTLAVMEAMKMEHVLEAPVSGTISSINAAAGETVEEGFALIVLTPNSSGTTIEKNAQIIDPDYIRPDLTESITRHSYGFDAARPAAVAKRHKTGHRTVRENFAELVDEGSLVEYGSLAIAAQRRRRSVDDLMQNTPADGMVTGIASVNGDMFPDQETQCIVMSYDYMVLAGTQGLQNHRKKDRMFELAGSLKLPVVLIAEGGGGRPGDTDGAGIAGLDCLAFELWGKLSGLVPRIGITTGRCFAGNAALLGASDVVIATKDANIGMGGPAMIEGGGLGIFTPDEIGPMDVQVPNGVVDIAVEDEAEAMQVAKRYLSYFQGRVKDWECADQGLLRHSIPENRLRIYDIRALINLLADKDSVLEIRAGFGLGMITAFARIEGRPVGLVANNPAHLSGAIDSDGADKAARFLQLCDAFDIPVVSLCDTPGIMVGPDIEKTALVRHAARMFVIGASLTVPFLTIVLRKGYGLGAQAMAGGGFKASVFTVTWPTGEFGGMGLEGAVKLGYRKELEAIEDPDERNAAFEKRVELMYQRGKAVNFATAFEIDDVIDPADTRKWILAGLKSAPAPTPRSGRKRAVDTW